MGWIEGILNFLRNGPKAGKLDINALFSGAVSAHQIDREKAIAEIDALVSWQEARKKWHQDKTRQKMAADGANPVGVGADLPGVSFKSTDFGLDEMDLEEMTYDEDESDPEDEDEAADDLDPIAAERKRRRKHADRLRRSAGEPVKPDVGEIYKLQDGFLSMLRMVLAE